MENEHKRTWQGYANTVMLAVIVMILGFGSVMLSNTFKQQKIRDTEIGRKLDKLLVATVMNDGRLNAINSEAVIWTNMIIENREDIELSKKEVDQKFREHTKYVDRYFQRKNQQN